MSQLMQELEIRRAIGEIDELSAKTQERMAHAAKMMAEAEAVGEAERANMIKFGAELRAGLERDMLEFRKSREELLTRLQISREKNEAVKYQAMLQTLGKRLDTEAYERVEEKRAVANVQASRGFRAKS